MATQTTRLVHFMVDFEGMTCHIRDLWAEGSYWKAIQTIDAMGVPQEYFADVIEGRKKMAQDPKGIKGVDGHLIEDDWQPNLANCHWRKYPRYSDLSKMLEQQKQWAEKYLDVAYMEVGRLWREFKGTRFNDRRLDEIIQQLKTYPEEILELAGVDMKRFLWEIDNADDFNPINNKWEIDVDAYIQKQLDLDKRPKPKPDTNFSHPTGAIAPNGKFYTCDWMEHSWLIYEVAKLKTVEAAKKLGWIMITHPLGKPAELKIIYGDKEPTNKQVTTLFDWKQKYGEAEIISPAGEW